ncbi:hypothetical protein CFC35_22980 [Streptomyces sp. FBKL.4005]|uniref:hypothetical protein n=1 Tax=Streptomyces sp. FBKL.4005 TaxID=2015515 RepID=UPI000B97BE85|nr:hypothetical protein [Streptomyces sp. FBKL.4005]OYP17015.1 hypothetical protein CFC35_22980 [Streptomyces sp. FBKL.4005]
MQGSTIHLLTAVVHFESAVFRAGQVARQLHLEHPHLTVKRASCSAYSSAASYDDPSASARLEIRADGVDGARAWAAVLDTELHVEVRGGTFVYEDARCSAVIDGVSVDVSGSRTLSDDEATAWRAEQGKTDGGER